MGAFDKFKELFSSRGKISSAATEVKSANEQEVAKFLASGSGSAAGKSVTESSSLSIAAAWSCMRVLSETIGSVPWHLYERKSDGSVAKVTEHNLASLLVSPNADMTAAEYREAKVLNLCQRGNTYSKIERRGTGARAQIVALNPIPSSMVEPMRKNGTNTRLPIEEGEPFYRISDRGRKEDFERDKVWHVKGFGGDGFVGLSPLAAAREAMGVALATEEFGARFFSQGGTPSGIVTVPGWLDPKQREQARSMLGQMLTGLGNAHRFALFEGGMKPEPWSAMPLEDMQFLALRQFSVAEICRFYRVPPHMVADLSRATFSNIEQQSQEFVMYTLLPYFTRFEASISKWLLLPEERNRFFVRFNFEGLLRADSTARASFYNSALQNGWMNRNEVREKENLNKVQGLDEYTVQANMTGIDQLVSAMNRSSQSAAESSSKSLMTLADAIKSSFGNRAPVVNASPPTINLPEIKMPPIVVNSPDVNVTIERSGAKRISVDSFDENGVVTGMKIEEAH